MILPQRFYAEKTTTVAKNLLGKIIVREIGNQRIAGKIVETEAYAGFDDKACHGYKGRTPRCEIMFGSPGFAYVFFTYGMHYLFNIVTEEINYPSAVLIRAVEPVSGLKIIQNTRKDIDYFNLTSGPAKFTKAFRIDKCFNGFDLTQGRELWLEEYEGISENEIASAPRIGVGYSEECSQWLCRFYIRDNKFVSRK